MKEEVHSKKKKPPHPLTSTGTETKEKTENVQRTINDESWVTEFPEKTRVSWENKSKDSSGNEGKYNNDKIGSEWHGTKTGDAIRENSQEIPQANGMVQRRETQLSGNASERHGTTLKNIKKKQEADDMVQERAGCTKETNNGRHGTTKCKTMVQGSRVAPKKMPWFFDAANLKILASIANGHIQQHIIKHSIISKNATISRLKRMVQENLLEKGLVQDEIDINKAHIVYKQTKACTKLLVGDEDEAQHQDFKSHEQKYKFELIQDADNLKLVKSIPCVNLRPLKNNVFKDFYLDSGNTIRLTSKHICFFSNTRLEADSIDNLNIKYIELAKADVRKFAQEYGIRYNPIPTIYQPSTFDCVSAEPLAKVLRERGNFNIKAAGIQARVDPSDKGIESNEENAREIEYRLFKMPQVIKELQHAISEQTVAIEKLTNEHKDDGVQIQEFIKTIGNNQLQTIEAIKAMSEAVKKITDIFIPKECKKENHQNHQVDSDQMMMYQ